MAGRWTGDRHMNRPTRSLTKPWNLSKSLENILQVSVLSRLVSDLLHFSIQQLWPLYQHCPTAGSWENIQLHQSKKEMALCQEGSARGLLQDQWIGVNQSQRRRQVVRQDFLSLWKLITNLNKNKNLKIPQQGKHRVSECCKSTGSKLLAWEKRGAFSKREKRSF